VPPAPNAPAHPTFEAVPVPLAAAPRQAAYESDFRHSGSRDKTRLSPCELEPGEHYVQHTGVLNSIGTYSTTVLIQPPPDAVLLKAALAAALTPFDPAESLRLDVSNAKHGGSTWVFTASTIKAAHTLVAATPLQCGDVSLTIARDCGAEYVPSMYATTIVRIFRNDKAMHDCVQAERHNDVLSAEVRRRTGAGNPCSPSRRSTSSGSQSPSRPPTLASDSRTHTRWRLPT